MTIIHNDNHMDKMPDNRQAKQATSFAMLVLTLLVVSLATVAMVAPHHPTGDYEAHLRFAASIHFDQTFIIPQPHFLYHILIALGTTLFPLSAIDFSIILLSAATTLVGFLLWQQIRQNDPRLATFFVMLLVLMILILTPATLLRFNRTLPNLYFGYFHPTSYHNPTFILARPFVFLITTLSMKLFGEKRLGIRDILLIMLVLTLGTLAKPNYLIAFTPALLLFGLWRSFTKKSVQWRALLIGIIVPSILLLTWQFVFTYVFDVTDASLGVGFRPFYVLEAHNNFVGQSGINTILIKYGMAILLPLAFFFLYPSVRYDNFFVFSVLVFLIASAQGILLLETGLRATHGNFLWGGHFALFVLYAATICAAVKMRIYYHLNWRLWIFCIIVILHLVSGFIWLYYSWIFSIDILLYW